MLVSAVTSSTTRSKARYARATRVLAKMTLGEQEAAALAALELETGLPAAVIVRRLIREAGALKVANAGPQPVASQTPESHPAACSLD